MTGERILVDTTNDENGEFEEISLDREKPVISIPSARYKANYDKIDWSKREGD